MQEYVLKVSVKNGKIVGIIEGGTKREEYAFYLKKEGIKVKTRWYSSKNTCKFVVLAGLYQVVGFVKAKNGETVILESEFLRINNEDNVSGKFSLNDYTISIFGSCVSRDLLEFDKDNNFILSKYFSRCSVVSAVSKPLPVKEEDINLGSSFQRRMVAADLDKKLWEELKTCKSDYLLVDFIDERFSVGKYNGTFFTLSNEMKECKYVQDYETLERVEKNNLYYVDEIVLNDYLNEFWRRMLSIYPADRIILHKARMSDYYYDAEGKIRKFARNHIKNNAKLNKLLDYMYEYSERLIEGCISIAARKECYASCKHKWGLAPMHYVDDYYCKVLDLINLKIRK